MEIKHASHDHPLILTDKYEKNGEYHCYGCELPITDGPTYCCSQCREFVLHKPCAELPQQIRHPFHPRHTLTLFNKKPFKSKRSTNPCVQVWCNACGKLCYGFIFRCERCNFDLDIGCASLLPTIRYGNHSKHLLTLFNKFYKKHSCESCRKPCGDAFILRCVECNFNVHKACAKLLSKQIRHPFHPLHSLTLTDIRSTHVCGGCNTRTTGSLFFCSCKGCPFVMCTRCASLVPTIKYEGHEHLLTLFDKISRGLFCSSCRKMCDDAFVFRCVDCNFSLHAKCLPTFPRTIKHKCHIDPLILTDTIVEDDGSGEFYCDACEKFRNPQHAVYYCAECEFVAHIGCVIDEVCLHLVFFMLLYFKAIEHVVYVAVFKAIDHAVYV